jgi:hypothetical protein
VYNAQELAKLHRSGKAYKLKSGAIIPTGTPHDIGAAIEQAEMVRGSGGDDDDPGFRAHLAGRAADIGAPQIIPGAWKHELASAKSTPLAKAAAGLPMSISVDTPTLTDLAHSRSLEDGLSELNRQGRLGEAARELTQVAKAAESLSAIKGDSVVEYERLARSVSDPGEAEAYSRLAKQARERLAGPDGLLAKATEYEQAAGRESAPATRESYLRLAAKARQEAGVA